MEVERAARHTTDRSSQKRIKDASQTLARGLRVLNLIAEAARPVTLREVASALKLPRSVVQRLVSTLEAEGYLDRNLDEGGYRLSIKMWSLGCVSVRHLEVREVARPVLQKLSLRSDETVKLSVLAGAHVVTMDSMMGKQTVRAYIPIGGQLPANVSATGRAVLAFMSRYQLAQHGYDEGGEKIFGPSTLNKLRSIRGLGYAVNRGEIGKDTAAVAAPVFNADGDVVASVGVVLPTIRLTSLKVRLLGQWVRQAGAEISAKLGYQCYEQKMDRA